jgi:hypothetical protein
MSLACDGSVLTTRVSDSATSPDAEWIDLIHKIKVVHALVATHW